MRSATFGPWSRPRTNVVALAAARNARLENAIHNARGELFGPHDLLAYKEPVDESRHDHQLIYDEIGDRNPEAAAAQMRHHIERTREQLRVIVFGDTSTNHTRTRRPA